MIRLVRSLRFWIAMLAVSMVVGIAIEAAIGSKRPAFPGSDASIEALGASRPPIATAEQVQGFCGDCHAYPTPDLFPKDRWRAEVERGFEFFEATGSAKAGPPLVAVVRYYEEHAPDRLGVLEPGTITDDAPFSFSRRGVPGPSPGELSSIAFVGPIGPGRPELLVCDMGRGLVMTCRLEPSGPSWTILSDAIPHPARAASADLDGDGLDDVIVADLGVPMPSDATEGRVVWLRGRVDGTFEEPVALADGLGRVADVRPADFDGDGDLDLIAAVFGWQRVGGLLALENLGGSGGALRFEARVVDPRHGAINVPVADLDGDGDLDVVALFSQEHESVVAFQNRGDGRFEPRTLFEAPHPAFGSSGIELTDLDGDGDLDVLLTNGDVYDSPLLKPYHGVSWLENLGDDAPFAFRPIGPLYGAHRAQAGDLDGDGDLDVVATAFLAEPAYGPERAALRADAVVAFEQTSPGTFRRHLLESVDGDYASFALGDLDLDGDLDLALGSFRNFDFGPLGSVIRPNEQAEALWIWENLGAGGFGPDDARATR